MQGKAGYCNRTHADKEGMKDHHLHLFFNVVRHANDAEEK